MSKITCSKTCENCKYFKRYYIISTKMSFVPTNQGYCVNYNVNKSISAENILKNDSCALWQPHELKKLARQIIMEDTLIKMQNTIENFLIVLRDEK